MPFAKLETASVFAKPGTPLYQKVTVCEKADEHAMEKFVLANDDAVHGFLQAVEWFRGFCNLFA